MKRALKEEDIWKWRAKKRAMLTEEHAAQRLAWTRQYKKYTRKDWEAVLFSDERSVEKTRDPRTNWVFATPQEKYHKDCIRGVSKGPDVKLMVWACI